MTLHSLQRMVAHAQEYPWKKHPFRAPVMQPPNEGSILPLEVAALCLECEVVYDERVGRCPKCAESSERSLKLVTVLRSMKEKGN